jgi:hypothetical protein
LKLGFVERDLAGDASPLDCFWQRRARFRPTEMSGGRALSLPLVFGGRDVAWSWTGRFQHLRSYGLVMVMIAYFSLRCSCSEQRIHSDLYDGLTWPDTGFASFD